MNRTTWTGSGSVARGGSLEAALVPGSLAALPQTEGRLKEEHVYCAESLPELQAASGISSSYA